MIQKTFTIRFSETDHEGHLSIPAFINYFQDLAIMDSDALQVRSFPTTDRQTGWIVTYWQLDIHRTPHRGEEVNFSAFIHRTTKLQVHRSFVAETTEGERLAEAYSVWILWDLERQKIQRIPQEYLERIAVSDPLPIAYTDRHIAFSETLQWKTLDETRVRWDQLDTNRHMNNVEYLKMIQSAFRSAAETAEATRFCIEYRQQAFLNDAIAVRAAQEANTVYIALVGEDESVLTRASVTLKE